MSAQLLIGMLGHVLGQAMQEGGQEIDEDAQHDDDERRPVRKVPNVLHSPNVLWPVSQSLSFCAALMSRRLTAFRSAMNHFGISDFP